MAIEKKRLRDSYFYKIFRRLIKRKVSLFGMIVVCLTVLLAIFGDWIMPYDPNAIDVTAFLQAPSSRHLLGTDELGRDLLSRMIYGARISILVGVVAVMIAFVTGTVLGLLAGYFGGVVDWVITNIANAIWAFPTLILALAITAVLGTGLFKIMLAIGIVYTPGFLRVVRSMVLSVRESEYVEAGVAIGLNDRQIIRKYIFPNVFSVIIVQGSLNAAQAIIAEASLSFLGLGVQLPNASWGSMLKTGYPFLANAPWLSIFPGIAIMLMVMGLNFLGDGLRDALDVKLKMD